MTSPQRRVTELWSIDNLPFVLGALGRPHNMAGLPDALPFVLGVDSRTGLVSQGANAEVDAALEVAYRTADAMPSNFDASGVGRTYADDFLAFIDDISPDLSGRRVLEIGSGTGYLLSQLQARGARVLGIEPGEHGQEGAAEYGIEIVHDFFPSPKVTGQFDLIVFSNVLEHLEDPVEFLRGLPGQLAPGGLIVVGVPDESAYITSGDVSTLFHEHWSYFDRRTLANTATYAGLQIGRLESASFGGSLYATMQPAAAVGALHEVEEAIALAEKYARTSQANSARIREFVDSSTLNGGSLGVYVPSRFVNVARIGAFAMDSIRFFDDDESAHGKFYPGFDAAMESRAQLVADPTPTVLIMSQTFGPKLAVALRELLPGTSVHTVADIL